MTEEDKKLLLKDLCARLPYDIIASVRGSDEEFQYFYILGVKDGKVWVKNDILRVDKFVDVEVVKPYLRPMSSMTDEEKAQVQMFMDIVTDENYGDGYSPSAWDAMNGFVQYCDSHHLDHRGLIFKCLAIEAPEGMYNN